MFDDYAYSDMRCRIDFGYQDDTFVYMETIGTRIRNRREALGLGQIKLAELIGKNQSTISNAEAGKGFRADVLMGLCDELRVTPEYIMRGSESDDVGEAEALSIYRRLDPAKRAAFLAMARGLVADPVAPLDPSKYKSKAGYSGQDHTQFGRIKPKKKGNKEG